MSDLPIIRLAGVGKVYRVFERVRYTRINGLLETLGLGRVMDWTHLPYRDFWALRGLDLELREGVRLGVVGRNGAGKSTLLKLISGSAKASEGAVQVDRPVQALMDLGAGFHPEFTGFENIEAALTYQGLDRGQIATITRDIVEFTEMGLFLGQPFHTYSAGMRARLSFATATATALLEPQILLIDEILGAGDAYFLSKCTERMLRIVHGGATVVLTSHSLEQILRLCDEAIWIERGHIVKRGTPLDVVKAYQQFTRVLDDRRLLARNRGRMGLGGVGEDVGETVSVTVAVEGPRATACDVASVAWCRGDVVEEELLLGSAQDDDLSYAASVLLDECGWSEPTSDGESFRRLAVSSSPRLSGVCRFNLPAVFADACYAVEVRYRTSGAVRVHVEVAVRTKTLCREELPVSADWTRHRLTVPRLALDEDAIPASDTRASARPLIRWRGEGTFTIESVQLLGPDGHEQAVFAFGTRLTMRVTMKAHKTGTFNLIPTIVLYRTDGLLVCRCIGESRSLPVRGDQEIVGTLSLGPLNLGNGNYVSTVAIYQALDVNEIEEAVLYDLVDRDYEFMVTGTPPLLDGIFRHHNEWQIDVSSLEALSAE